LGRLFEDKTATASTWDPCWPFSVRRRALVSARVAVTSAVNHVLCQRPARFPSMKVQVNGIFP
jgi:hypothetical protein